MHFHSSFSLLVLLQATHLVGAQNCGPNIGQCEPGLCCSQWGYCGDTPEHCGVAAPPPSQPTQAPPASGAARPKYGNVPYGVIINQCDTPGKIALTYDDGPWIYTSQLLDILASSNVPATFFVTGTAQDGSKINNAALAWPDLIRRMISSGHQVASHTYSHASLWSIPDDARRSELTLNENAFLDILGYYPTYFRCPYLECDADSGTLGLLAEYGYHVIGVNADTKDYMYDAPDLIFNAKNNFANTVSGDAPANSYITLMHDVKQQTVLELTRFVIDTARARGYQLVTVGECLGDPRENWYRNRDGSANGGGAVTTNPPTTTVPTSTIPAPTTLVTATRPAATTSLTVSTDSRCGGTTGFTCQGSGFGNCCSQYGWCGSTTDYCGTGCNAAFGTCT